MKEKKALKLFIIILSCITVLTLLCMPMISAKADYAESVGAGDTYSGGTVISCEEGSVINAIFLSSSYETIQSFSSTQSVNIPDGEWQVNMCEYDEENNQYNFQFVKQESIEVPKEEPELTDVPEPNEVLVDGAEFVTPQVNNGDNMPIVDVTQAPVVSEQPSPAISPIVDAPLNGLSKAMTKGLLGGPHSDVIVVYYFDIMTNNILRTASIQKAGLSYSTTYQLIPPVTERNGWEFNDFYIYSSRYTANEYVNVYSLYDEYYNELNIYCNWKGKFIYNDNFGGSDVQTEEVNYKNSKFEYASMYVRPKYHLVGWSENSGNNTVQYKCGDNISKYSNIQLDNNHEKNLYAVWKRYQYDVEFKPNGGTGTAMSNMTFSADNLQPLPQCSYTKDKCKCVGWSTDPNATEPAYSNGAKVDLSGFDQDTVTLYAVWQRNCYNVRFESNGAGPSHMESKSFNVDNLEPLPTCAYTRENYKFLGWSKDPNATQADYADGATVNLYDPDHDSIVLYAVWQRNYYKVEFNNNGGTSGTAMMDQTCIIDDLKPLNKCTFKKDNYKFIGWSTDPASTTAEYSDGATVDLSGLDLETVTLYAIWQREKYTVVFHANGGTGDMSNQLIDSNNIEPLKACNFVPVTGYKFLGWSLDPSATEAAYTDKTKESFIGLDKDYIDLYAVWELISYNVRFNPNGGCSIANNTITVKYGEIFAIPNFNVEREGYEFLGWSRTNDNYNYDVIGTTGTNLSNLSATDKEMVNLYAKWKPDEVQNLSQMDGYYLYTDSKFYVDEDMTLTYYGPNRSISTYHDNLTASRLYTIYTDYKNKTTGTDLQPYMKWYFRYDSSTKTGTLTGVPSIEYDANQKGTGVMTRTEGQKYADEPYFRANVAQCTFTPAVGYSFKEWNTKADGTGQKYDIYNDSVEEFNHNSTEVSLKLYAIWQPISYKIKFEPNSAVGTMPQMENLVYDKEYTLLLNSYTKNDYVFVGWALTPDAKEPVYKDGEKIKNLVINDGGTLVLYALWTREQVHIKYDPNGGKGDIMPDTIARYNIPTNLADNKYSKKGSVFLGWSTDKKAKDPMYVNGALIKNPECDEQGNYYLYAIWFNTVTPTPEPTPTEEIQPAGDKPKNNNGKKENKEPKQENNRTTPGEKKVYNISPTPVVEDVAQILSAVEHKESAFDEKAYLLNNSTALDPSRQKISLSAANILIDDQELFLKAVERIVGRKEKAALTDVFAIDYYEKNNDGEWTYVEQTDKLYRITLDVPQSIKSTDADYCMIMKNGKTVSLVCDLDDNPDTITIAVDDFESQYIMLGINNLETILAENATVFSNSGLVVDIDKIDNTKSNKKKGLGYALICGVGVAWGFTLIYLIKTRLYPHIKKKRDE